MGVNNVQFYQEGRDSKPLFSGNGQGGCCAYFTTSRNGAQQAKGASSLDVAFGGYYFKEIATLFDSPLVQALVPGTRYLPRGEHPFGSQQTIHVPYKGIPADQVSIVLRLAKQWIGGTYVEPLRHIKLQFPELRPELQAVLAVALYTFEPDSDSGVSFVSPTIKEYADFYKKRNQNDYSWSWSQAPTVGLTCEAVVELLKGVIRPGKQPNFEEGQGYFKAGFVRSRLMNTKSELGWGAWESRMSALYGDDEEPTANYPVVLKFPEGTKLPDVARHGTNVKIFKSWVEKNGIDLNNLGEAQGGNSQRGTEAGMQLPGSPDTSSGTSDTTGTDSSTQPSQTSSELSSVEALPSRPSSSRSSEPAPSSNPSIDWSQAPKGAQRAIPNFYHDNPKLTDRTLWLKQSRTTGFVYWRNEDVNNWVRYYNQQLGLDRLLEPRCIRKPRTRRTNQE
jgi:hypothetical protein